MCLSDPEKNQRCFMKDGRRYSNTWNGITWAYLTLISISFAGLMCLDPNNPEIIENNYGALIWWFQGFSNFYY